MKSKILWVHAAVLSLALVAGFLRQDGLAADAGELVLLAIEVALVWIFAALAIKARIFEPDRETVHERSRGGSMTPLPVPDTGVLVRPRLPRL